MVAGKGTGYDPTLPLKNTVLEYVNGEQVFFIRLQTSSVDEASGEENSPSHPEKKGNIVAILVPIIVVILVTIVGVVFLQQMRKRGRIWHKVGEFGITDGDGRTTLSIMLNSTEAVIEANFFVSFQKNFRRKVRSFPMYSDSKTTQTWRQFGWTTSVIKFML